jgi:hypothetical protein
LTFDPSLPTSIVLPLNSTGATSRAHTQLTVPFSSSPPLAILPLGCALYQGCAQCGREMCSKYPRS